MKLQLLNSDASLNNFFVVDAVAFVPGENLTLVVRLIDSQKSIRYVPTAAATLTLNFTDSDGNTVTKPASVLDASDRSIWTVALSQAETQTLVGSNIEAVLDTLGDTTVIIKAVARNVLSRENLSGDC